MNFQQTTTAQFKQGVDTLFIQSKVVTQRADQRIDMITNENWILQEKGTILSIQQYSSSSRGRRDITMVFDRE